MKTGPERLKSDLKNLGYDTEIVKGQDGQEYCIINQFEIPIGRFTGTIIDLGILAPPDYPKRVGSCIHVLSDPILLDYNDSAKKVRNIIKSKLGDDWRYWSFNFQWNGGGNTQKLMRQINGIFKRI